MSEDKNKELEDLLAKLKKYEEVLDDESDFDESSMNELIEQTLSQLSETIALKKDSENTKYTLKYVNISDNKDPKDRKSTRLNSSHSSVSRMPSSA